VVDTDVAGPRQVQPRQVAEGARAPGRDQQPHRAAERRQHQALGEELAHEPQAAPAHGGADRDFAVARGGAGEQQVRDVGATDQQHEAHRAEQHEQRGPYLPHHSLRQRDALGLPAERGWIVVRVALREPAGQRQELGLELVDRGAGLEPADEVEHARPTQVDEVGIGVVQRHRRPQLHRRSSALDRMTEAFRHDADDGDRIVIEPHRPSDHRPLAAEPLLPQIVRDQGHVADVALVVGLGKVAPQHGRRAEQREVVVAHYRGLDPLGLVRAGQVDVDRPHGGQVADRRHFREEIVVFGLRHGHLTPFAAQQLGPEAHQLIRLRIRQRLEQHRVDHAEDRGVGADAQRERQHGHDGERRAPPEPAQRESKIPPERVHHATSTPSGAPGTRRPS
jgi:hypothetical protein